MKYNLLGNTGLKVSELCLGTTTFGGKGWAKAIGTLDRPAVDAIVKRSIDAGINFIDTDAKGISVAQIAVAWLLKQPVVTSVIIGANKMEQLQDNLKSVDVQFSPEEWERLNTVK